MAASNALGSHSGETPAPIGRLFLLRAWLITLAAMIRLHGGKTELTVISSGK
ncbi:MAG: hypothetical protein AAFV88_02655 [Planctomycetota bacterium]